MQNRGSSTRCDHKPSRETSLSESSFAIRRRSNEIKVGLVSPPAPCRKGLGLELGLGRGLGLGLGLTLTLTLTALKGCVCVQ